MNTDFLLINNTLINKTDISSIRILKVDENLTTALFCMKQGENVKLQVEKTKENLIEELCYCLK